MSAILQNQKVLITRGKSQAKYFSDEIRRFGGIPIEVPLLKITCITPKNKLKVLAKLKDFQWIFFTSANGVDCFFDMLEPDDANAFGSCKFAVVGSKTELALRSYGFSADFIPTRYNADHMANEFMTRFPSANKILLVRGNMSRDVLPRLFLKHGYTIDLLEVYETTYNFEAKEILNQRLLAEDIDMITFASPSTVDAFVELIDKNVYLNKICVCIGTTTEMRAKKQGFQRIIVPEKFTVEGMVERICDYITMEG